jgi:CheY-like chemotaxis protein
MPKASAISVLIVDDQQSMRGICKYILNQLGFKDIIEAKSGRDALTKIEKATFDLIISDWNMDDIDGLTLLKVLRRMPDNVVMVERWKAESAAPRRPVFLAIIGSLLDNFRTMACIHAYSFHSFDLARTGNRNDHGKNQNITAFAHFASQ